MHTRCKEREIEIEMVFRKHPFVVLRFSSAIFNFPENIDHLTMDIDSEKKYHEAINKALISEALSTLQFAKTSF